MINKCNDSNECVLIYFALPNVTDCFELLMSNKFSFPIIRMVLSNPKVWLHSSAFH